MSEEFNGDQLTDPSQSVSFGDRVWVFCMQHIRVLKQLGIVLVTIALLGVIAVVAHSVSKHSREQAYINAQLSGDIESFARKYPNSPLAGTCFMELGNRAYGQQKFSKAKEYYHRAVNAFGYDVFGGKAEICEGMAQIREGNIDAGENLLRNIGESKKYPGYIRGKALWSLGMNLWGRKETAKAKDLFNKLKICTYSSYWQDRAEKILKEI